MSQTKFKVIENNNMDKENRNKSLEAAVGLIEKNYGKGSIMKLGSKTNVEIESISTGLLDLAYFSALSNKFFITIDIFTTSHWIVDWLDCIILIFLFFEISEACFIKLSTLIDSISKLV